MLGNIMLETIYNYRQLASNLITAGQPDEDELHEIGAAGFEVVVNLGLEAAEYSLSHERAILESYGIDYYHIPVDFAAPKVENFTAFVNILKNVLHKKVFVHCAANKRVSVFVALFRVLEQGVPFADARKDILSIWIPNEEWTYFMSIVLGNEVEDVDQLLNEDPLL